MKLKIFLIISLTIALGISAFSFILSQKGYEENLPLSYEEKAEMVFDRAMDFYEKGDKESALSDLNVLVNKFPETDYAERSLRKLAEYHLDNDEKEKADYYYRRLLNTFDDVSDAKDIEKKLEGIRVEKLFSEKPSEDVIEYVVKPGDSLYAIAKKFDTTIAFIKKINMLTSDIIHPGQKLKVNISRFSIHVDKSDNILILKKDGVAFKKYIVATGRDNCTPVGIFTIVNKMIEPPWTKPGQGVIMPDNEEYELGSRWMGISKKGYGIHGTNDDSSIGSQSTAGCVRMYNPEVEELYDIVTVGTEVEIVD